jgi:parvulin-like peptidyl-prolyl isomerase
LLYAAYDADLKKKVEGQVTNEEADQYYRTHPQEFEKVFVRHIVISTEPPESESDVAPAPLTPDEARQKAEAVFARARAGEDFAKLAAENSDDPSGKETGGELGFIAKGSMNPAFKSVEDKALSLKVGEVALVESPLGFHIIKVESREPIAPPGDPRLRQMIKENLKGDRYNERVKQIVESSRVEIAENFDTTPKQPPPAAQQQ